MTAIVKHQPDPAEVLAKALFRASDQLGLKQTELAEAIGLHRSGVTRLKNKMMLEPTSKTGELALLIIRVARSLFALEGGNPDGMKDFMRSENRMTGGVPADQIKQIQGLVTVVEFLDAIRGKV